MEGTAHNITDDTSNDEVPGSKRPADDDVDITTTSPTTQRPRLNFNKETKSDTKGSKHSRRRVEKWMTNCMTDDYVDLVGDIIYPKCTFGSASAPGDDKFPLQKLNSLGYLLNPIRHKTVLEKWSPFEVAVFEASITLYGKNFNKLQKLIKSKTCKEVIEFYYDWKKTSHYDQWKKTYRKMISDEREIIPHEEEPSSPAAPIS